MISTGDLFEICCCLADIEEVMYVGVMKYSFMRSISFRKQYRKGGVVFKFLSVENLNLFMVMHCGDIATVDHRL